MRNLLLLVVGACTADAPKADGHATSDPTTPEPTTPPVPDTESGTTADTGAVAPPPVPCQADTTNLRGLEIDVFGDVVRFGSYDGVSGAFAPSASVDSAASLLNEQEGLVDFDAGLFSVVTNDAAGVRSLLTIDSTTSATVWQPTLTSTVRHLHYDRANARVVGWAGGFGTEWSVGTLARDTGVFAPLASHADVVSPHGAGRSALDSAGQRLFSIVGEASGAVALYTIDLSTGDRIDRVELAGPFVELSSLVYDEAVGQLLAMRTTTAPHLVTLDPSTGDTLLVGAGQEWAGGGNWRLLDPRTRLMWTSCSWSAQSVCAVCTVDGTAPVILDTAHFPYFAYPL